METPDELPIPQTVLGATSKAEMARIWIADGNQVVILSPRTWDDPGAWGLMLVDLAMHVSRAYAAKGITAEAALSRIRECFDAEWKHPTQ